MYRIAFRVGLFSALIVLIVGAVGINMVHTIDPDLMRSPTYASMENVLGISVALFFVCAAVLWWYAFKKIQKQWNELVPELRFARVLILMFGFHIVGFYYYYIDEIRRPKIVS